MTDLNKVKADYEAGTKYKDIAAKYGVTVNTVKSWIRRNGWSRNKTGTKKRVHPKIKQGAPIGNQNAIGNVGGGAPTRNKNAVVTGEHESILLSELDDEERKLYDQVQTDPLTRIDEEIRILTIRERRMLARLKAAQDDLTDEEVTTLTQLINDKMPSTNPKGRTVMITVKHMADVQISTVKTSQIDLVLRLEESLTKVSAQLNKAVATRQSIINADVRNELVQSQNEIAKTQNIKLRADLGIDDDDDNDDGFIDAIKGRLKEVWNDED